MAQVSALVAALKSALKAASLTYAEVARELELSESSIKRKFSRQDFSMSRLCVNNIYSSAAKPSGRFGSPMASELLLCCDPSKECHIALLSR